jgi:tripartite motif-containing protein 37
MMQMELLDTILHELDQQLNSIPKSDLIAQEPHMSHMLQGIQTRTFSDISPTPISPDFTSEVVPAYEYGELVIKNYKMHLSQIRPTMFHLGSSNNDNSPRDLVFSKDVVFSEVKKTH